MGEEFEMIFQDTPQELYLHWRAVAEDFGLDHFPNKRESLQGVIQEFFDQRDIPTRNISRVQNFEEQNYIVLDVNGELYYFDIYSEQYCGTNLTEANSYRLENPSDEVRMITQGVPVLEELMDRNYARWGFGEYLNNNDVVDFDAPEIFRGMTIREVQMTLRANIRIFELNGGILGIDSQRGQEIAQHYRKYMEIIMGIGDRYEQGSYFFYKTEGELDVYIRSSIYSFGSFEECTDYYTHIQSEIYNNTAQSKSNKRAYRIFSQKLGSMIFERFQRELDQLGENNEDNQNLINEGIHFIELLRGREQNHSDVDSDMRNPILAEEVCIFLLSRQGGILDTLENCTRYSLDFTDEVVGDRSPSQVVNEVESRLLDSGFENPTLFLHNNFGVDRELIVGTENDRYEDLSLEHKRQISMLARLIQKFDEGEMSLEQIQSMGAEGAQQYIVELGQEITNEAFEAVREAYDRNFDADSYGGRSIYIPPDFVGVLEDIGVSDSEIQVLRLFNDIRGHDVRGWDGFMNYSDENLNSAGSLARSAGIIIGTIAVVMIATAVTGGVALPALASMGVGQALIASGGGLSLAGSLTSIGVGASMGTLANFGLDPRSHDTVGEMLGDIGSDFVINTFHALWMERLTMRLWQGYGTLGRSTLIGGDLASGIGIELIREYAINNIFQGQPLLGEIHSITIEDALFWAHYERIQELLTPEMNRRFENASHIYYLWTGEEVDMYNQTEFGVINWSDAGDIMSGIESWIEIQEARG